MVDTSIRGLSDQVYAVIRRQAERQHRSINAQLVHMLEDSDFSHDRLADLRERLASADAKLNGMTADTEDPLERIRLRGKAEGVRLAISYLDEAVRGL